MGAKRAAVQTVLDLPVSPREELFKIISFFGWEGTMVNLQHPFFWGGHSFTMQMRTLIFQKLEHSLISLASLKPNLRMPAYR